MPGWAIGCALWLLSISGQAPWSVGPGSHTQQLDRLLTCFFTHAGCSMCPSVLVSLARLPDRQS